MKRDELEQHRLETGFWEKRYHWDQVIDLAKARQSQMIGGWNAVNSFKEYYTSSPRDRLALLALAAWIVGAGKTLGMSVIASAVNHVRMQQLGPNAPRIRSILVLTIDSALRTQIARSFEWDCTGTGMYKTAPSVLEWGGVEKVHKYHDNAFDVVVACVHKLWPRKGKPKANIDEILAKFDIIFFDEMHFADEHVFEMVRMASHAFCFGMTGTPIEANGDILPNLAMLSIYYYYTSSVFDGSLKYLSDQPEDFERLVNVLKTAQCRASYGDHTRILNGLAADHDKQLEPVAHIAHAVIQDIIALDRVVERYENGDMVDPTAAPHRAADSDDEPRLVYDPHAMIVVESIEIADLLVEYANQMMKYDRRCSEARGYKFIAAHSKSELKLNSNHPWLLATNNQRFPGRVQPGSARFLVVVDIGREGLDNPACARIGVAIGSDSLLEPSQRWWGRQIRAYVKRCGDKRLVPIEELDRPKIITHEAYGNVDIIRESLNYLLSMPAYFAGIPYINEASGLSGASLRSRDRRLSTRDMRDILGNLGLSVEEDPAGAGFDRWADERFGFDDARRAQAGEWLDTVIADPTIAENLVAPVTLDALHIVRDEKVTVEPTDADLILYIDNSGNERLMKHRNKLHVPDTREFVLICYEENQKQLAYTPLVMNQPIDQVVKGIAHEVRTTLGRWYDPKDDRYQDEKYRDSPLYFLTWKKVKEALGVSQGTTIRKGEKYDDAATKGLLVRSDVKQKIVDGAIREVISQGHCPAIAEGIYRLSYDPNIGTTRRPRSSGRPDQLDFLDGML